MAKPSQPRPIARKEPAVPTLEMVAAAAGVSPSTVSRLLNGTAKVSADKRKAVESAIRKLDFVANPVASGLAGGRSRSIGVITQALGSPFYGNGLLGIEDVLVESNYAPLYVSGHWRPRDEQRCLALLESRRVDGMIILTPSLPDADLLALAQRVPLVVTGRSLLGPRLCSLDFDNTEGARLATEHLIALGHTRIAFIKGTASHPDAVERLRGYRIALKAHGIPFDAALTAQGHFIESGGAQATEALLAADVKFTALLAANDQMAYGAALALYRRGLRVPEQVSLVGFDDLMGSSYTLPPLTSVRHSIHEIGRLAAHAVIALIRGEPFSDPVPAPQLMVRESCGPVAGSRRHGRTGTRQVV
ncbi:MAG: LacI family DNA-binding transcriptional regulator [Pseudomonadota bacterium]|nr:LacI family DNA-binding transcriptional regulator [Pseudomonadota bacterium]